MSDNLLGYTDTPLLPDTEYRVHDPDRPRPPAVEPGGPATQDPPSDATILFDGSTLSGWEHSDGSTADWNLFDDYLEVAPGAGDIQTENTIGDCHLHLEWASPSDVEGAGQGRGNSGVFLMDRYEIQILDCYDNPTYADGYAGAVYGQYPPFVNACRKPGEWQSYDILWTTPRFDVGDLATPARVTVLHNGVVVQHETAVNGPTNHKQVVDYSPHAPEAPLRLQDHGDQVRFRNIWYRPFPR